MIYPAHFALSDSQCQWPFAGADNRMAKSNFRAPPKYFGADFKSKMEDADIVFALPILFAAPARIARWGRPARKPTSH
ncbi:MAG: hypothetical protein A2Z25_01775 [Planctomycetes bacterium RBG_16_55_9]|nr:MAG: hypothetical protein A2Z25_01775 [Planctomycetes bacterium RBG_16_55_9]